MNVMNKFLATLAILLLPALAQAHGVNVFAYVDGDTIFTSSGFSKKSRVIGGTLEVYNTADNTMLLSGTTDENGDFSFAIPDAVKANPVDLKLVINAGEGHRADWTIKSNEYAPENAPVAEAAAPAPEAGKDIAAAPANIAPEAYEAMLEKVVARQMKKELQPIKHVLAEMSQSGPGLSEIMGGIGYLIGLAGIAAWARSRKRQ